MKKRNPRIVTIYARNLAIWGQAAHDAKARGQSLSRYIEDVLRMVQTTGPQPWDPEFQKWLDTEGAELVRNLVRKAGEGEL